MKNLTQLLLNTRKILNVNAAIKFCLIMALPLSSFTFYLLRIIRNKVFTKYNSDKGRIIGRYESTININAKEESLLLVAIETVP